MIFSQKRYRIFPEVVTDLEYRQLRSPQEHFDDLEAILERHAAALEAEVRQLQQSDETAQWPTAWKHIYNWHFAQAFVLDILPGVNARGFFTLH